MNCRLSYDRNTGQYSSTSDSITVSVPGFGDTYSVERKGNGLFTFPLFDVFVGYFVKRGYERGRSIRAAPYDWRLGPGGWVTTLLSLLFLAGWLAIAMSLKKNVSYLGTCSMVMLKLDINEYYEFLATCSKQETAQ